jgi:hypothetical protein
MLKKVALVCVIVSCCAAAAAASRADDQSVEVSVYASGFNNPRGLKFGPDGDLYVVEAGLGGDHEPTFCVPDPPSPFDPYVSGYTGRITKIDSRTKEKTIVADLLPSTIDNTNTVLGPVDVAFIGKTLYVVVFAGCARFFEDVPTSVVRVNHDGTWEVIANLSQFFRNNPTQEPPDDDFEPDGAPNGMVAVQGALYIVEANSGQLIRVRTNGDIRRIADLSKNHPTPASIAYNGDFYVGTFGSAGTNFLGEVYKVTASGKKQVVASGLAAVVGIAAHRGKLYVLESLDPFGSGAGRVSRLSRFGKKDKLKVIAEGLTFPTAMTMGRDGNLYVSNKGYAFGEREGEVVRIELGEEDDD